jgi:cytosine/adenosine deaminase-related metal-dependent hydrolase
MRRYHARWLLPVTRPPVRDGTVVVDDAGRIAYVGPRAQAPAGDDRELGDAILLPGLVNAHTHLELTAMRGVLEPAAFAGWVRTVARARHEVLMPDMLLDAARSGLMEGLAAGVTTFADSSTSGASLRAMRELGVRGVMFQEVLGPAPEQRGASLAQLQAVITALRPFTTALVGLGVAPHAVYAVHEDLLIDVCAYALGERLPIAIHVAESAAEIEFLREGRGPLADALRARGIDVERRAHSPVHLLVELGIDIAAPMLLHGVHLDASDVAFVAERGCPVVHCPTSNAKLGHGVAPVAELIAAGATVALGTDSMASGDRMDVLAEARLAVLSQRARLQRHDALDATRAVAMATIDGARALGLGARVGSLEVGKMADLAAFAVTDTHAGVDADPAAALVHGVGSSGARASLVTVAGRELVRDGRVLHADPALAGRVDRGAAALARWVTRASP